MDVREATSDDVPAVMNVIDGAALEIDVETVHDGIDTGGTLVAVSDDSERILGALVLDGDHIEAVAVRRRRRGQGIGSTLVEHAIDRRERVTASFSADVRPFYESLGFEIEPDDDPDRYRGRRYA